MIFLRVSRPRARRRGATFFLILSAWTLVGPMGLDPWCAVARADEQTQAIDVLLRKLDERDAVIRDLQRRVSELESRIGAAPGTATSAAPKEPGPSQAAAPPPRQAAEEPRPSAPRGNGLPPPQPPGETVAAATPPSPPPTDVPPQPDPGAQPQATAPGQFEVDEEAADRALERTLVQAGVLLLPVGVAEIQPSFVYSRNERGSQGLISINNVTFVGTDAVRSDTLIGDLQLRFGLPFDSQFEFGVPYRYVDQSIVTSIRTATPTERESSGSGFGDIRVGLAKTLLREEGLRPDLVARLTWDTSTGEDSDDGLVLGGGFNELVVGLSALKRQDPLAFSAGFSYQKTFEHDHIEPGDAFTFALGAALAASPATSLQVALRQTFTDKSGINGGLIPGSDQVIGELTVGASTVIGRRSLLSFSTDIGLTDDAPDYTVGLSFSTRFDMPTLKMGRIGDEKATTD